ncbi:MAG: sugar phosphate isomerase/epimerase [Firmicutes bacterium]|jgi:sugar phosphate isomerase/epimerase|nr:sugar phosphate isomerase/epimerase [Bacillota bacterium]
MIRLGMHTDNWRSLSGSFTAAIDSAAKYKLDHVEFGMIDGQYFIQAMGYEPSITLRQNPLEIRKMCESRGLKISQIDGSYPMMGFDGAVYGVQYVQQCIRFARDLGCPKVDTTDSGRVYDMPREDILKQTIRNYQECLKWAEDYKIIINVEPHGPYTGDIDFMQKLFSHFESEYLRFNMDTGNTYIQGNDPLEFLKTLRKYVTHAHIKDVSAGLAAALRGEATGIGVSEVGIGEGVNADNIKKCIQFLKETNWDGDVSIECSGVDEKIAFSVNFLRGII